MASKQVQPQTVLPVLRAIEFVREYALSHEFFGSEEVCNAYKAAGLPEPEGGKGWRDKWGGVMTRSKVAGYIQKAGKFVPTSGATHMASTALWQSKVFKGERTAVETGKDEIERLYQQWATRKFNGTLRDLLWHAYEFGFDQAATGREKLKHAQQ
jgi:hypothetical protein